MILATTYIIIDFSSSNDGAVRSTARLALPELETDRAYFYKINNRLIVVIRYSAVSRRKLFQQEDLNSSQWPEYFVALAYGTDLGCPLEAGDGQYLKESCSDTRYDFAGRPLNSKLSISALRVPDYKFCPDYSCLKLQLK